MEQAILILSLIVILLFFLNRKNKSKLLELTENYEILFESKNPSEIDSMVWQIEKTEGGYSTSVYNNREPYECFIEMGKEQLIEILKERL